MRSFLLKSKLDVHVRVKHIIFILGLIFNLISSIENCAGMPVKVLLAKDREALHSVVVPSGASELTHGDGLEGIAVGTYKDFPQLKLEDFLNSEDPTRRYEYLLRTIANGVCLVGATNLAAQHAVWDFLYRIGCRQLLSTDTWEIVPEDSAPTVRVYAFERLDFYNRYGPLIVTDGIPADSNLWQRWELFKIGKVLQSIHTDTHWMKIWI